MKNLPFMVEVYVVGNSVEEVRLPHDVRRSLYHGQVGVLRQGSCNQST